MKIYTADQILPVSSAARAPDLGDIPPWTVPGSVTSKIYGLWSPRETLRVTGGRVFVTSGTPGRSIGIAMLKHNVYERNVVIAQAILSGAVTLEVPMTVPNAMTAASVISPYDTIQLAVFITDSQAVFKNMTVQLYSEKVKL